MTTKMKRRPVELSKSDWEEIAATLETKMGKLQKGAYGTCMEHDEKKGRCHCTADWIGHVGSILERIGDDGKLAAEHGTLPSNAIGGA